MKEKFFRNAAVTQRPLYPLFEGPGNDCSPESFFSGSIIAILKYRAFKHECPLYGFCSPDRVNRCRLRTIGAIHTGKIKEFHRSRVNKIRIVRIKRLGARTLLPLWSPSKFLRSHSWSGADGWKDSDTGFFARSHIEITDYVACRIYRRSGCLPFSSRTFGPIP